MSRITCLAEGCDREGLSYWYIRCTTASGLPAIWERNYCPAHAEFQREQDKADFGNRYVPGSDPM